VEGGGRKRRKYKWRENPKRAWESIRIQEE
jgi:hypothetical protein